MGHENGRKTTQGKIDAWQVATPLLHAMYDEFKELSKKKPESAVSKGKIVVVNRLLEKCRETLADEESLPFLDVLNEDDVPQCSDVVLMLSQYVAAMKRFHGEYYGYDGRHHTWAIAEERPRKR